MPAAPWINWMWPGLSRLWLRGQWSGLVWAVVFSALLSGLLLTSFLWTELIGSALRGAGWVMAASMWLVWVWINRRDYLAGGKDGGGTTEDLFIQAQGEYLRGNWYEAESLLKGLLRRDPRDAEGRLMLATLYRHTQRLDDAQRELRALGRLEAATQWTMEIRREWELLRSGEAETQPQPQQATTPGQSVGEEQQAQPPADLSPAA